MTLRMVGISVATMMALLPLTLASMASALTVTCVGTPATASITWNASASGGVEPYAFLWGNNATASSQTVSAASGVHTMTLQATDASTTVATTSCSATVAAVSTSTTPDSAGLATRIQALLAQINALRAQIAQLIAGNGGTSGGTATSTPAGCFGFWRDLKHGDVGDDVKELQQQLAKDDPTLFPPGLVTGFFGPKTEAALKMFQRRFGIDASGTGFFGSKSRGHLASLCSNGDSDKDGINNRDDSDDDNDGTEDRDDRFPFNPNATSTSMRKDDDRGKNEWKNSSSTDNRGKSKQDDDDSDDD